MDLVPGLEGYQGLATATSLSTLHPIRLACLVPPYRVKDFARQNGVGCRLEITITHVPRHDFVVIAHTLDHEILDQLANAEFELDGLRRLAEKTRTSHKHRKDDGL
jgi:hypothetical protein